MHMYYEGYYEMYMYNKARLLLRQLHNKYLRHNKQVNIENRA